MLYLVIQDVGVKRLVINKHGPHPAVITKPDAVVDHHAVITQRPILIQPSLRIRSSIHAQPPLIKGIRPKVPTIYITPHLLLRFDKTPVFCHFNGVSQELWTRAPDWARAPDWIRAPDWTPARCESSDRRCEPGLPRYRWRGVRRGGRAVQSGFDGEDSTAGTGRHHAVAREASP